MRSSGYVLLLAFIFGVLLAEWPGIPYVWLAGGCLLAAAIPWFWRTGPRAEVWIAAGLVGFAATLYFLFRVPQPTAMDVSRYAGNEVTVRGTVVETPTLNREQNVRFVFETRAIFTEEQPQTVSGKLYVTVPILQGTGLTPGQELSISGYLYDPPAPRNPGGFDFRAYLAKKGIFAGLKGDSIDWNTATATSGWGWWQLRQRIVRTQVERLGVPEGTLLSAMVLGRRAVDLPYDVRDRFVRVGLAHALAASGFHVSLILGAVLGVGRNLGDRSKFFLGSATLLLYVGLVGFQPSVLRAALMGLAGLLGLATRRRVNPVGALLVAATLLLLVNPLWIRDLGFQLSFLATLGLVVTVPPLVKRLDWLPPVVSPLLAVPVAAIVWTLPLQLYTFGQMPVYSVVVNVVTTPFLALVTLGGFVSGLAALVFPPAGSFIAWGLTYPIRGLLQIVEFFSMLPKTAIAVDKISVLQVAILYGILGMVWWISSREKPKFPKFAGFFSLCLAAMAIVVVPAVGEKANLRRVTVLATREQPSMVLQQGWKTMLVHGGDEDNTRYAVLPFLRSEGVNQLEMVVAMSDGEGWDLLGEMLPETGVYGLEGGEFEEFENIRVEKFEMKSVLSQSGMLRLSGGGETWAILGDATREEQERLLASGELSAVSVVCFWGRSLDVRLLEVLNPSIAILASDINDAAKAKFEEMGVSVFRLDVDGAIQWTPNREFEPVLEGSIDRF
ncbi:ComEC/Rec2 family competence protein [Baaleninema sp.]|uniref:ComEC/Rec2 family competence protein n=1 Tax=Baaleninema sp. TaxID=3101197 RepID=UPI003D05639F